MLQRSVNYEFISGKWHVTFKANFFGNKTVEVTDYLQAPQDACFTTLKSMATGMATNVGINMTTISAIGGFTLGNVTRNFGREGSADWCSLDAGD